MSPSTGYVDVSRESRPGISLLFVGLLAGAAIGGIAALLLAPRSGRETREMIRGKAMETQQMVQERVNDVKNRVGQIRQNMQSRAEEEAQKVESAR
jgi:gas vesicle protein